MSSTIGEDAHALAPPSCERAAVTVELVDETSADHQFTDDEHAHVVGIATRTAMEVEALLPDLPEDLRVVVATVDDLGVIANDDSTARVVLGDGQPYVRWEVRLDPGATLSDVADANLRGELLHEWHHITRYVQVDLTTYTELIDNVVDEGLATAFARDATGVEPPHAVYPDEVSSWADELLEHGSYEDYGEWMWLHPDGRRWIGYRVGTWIVDRAMLAADSSAAELVHASTDEILELAGIPIDGP